MPARRSVSGRIPSGAYRISVLFALGIVALLMPEFLSGSFSGSTSSIDDQPRLIGSSVIQRLTEEKRGREALEIIEAVFPKELVEEAQRVEEESLQRLQGSSERLPSFLRGGNPPTRSSPLDVAKSGTEAEEVTSAGNGVALEAGSGSSGNVEIGLASQDGTRTRAGTVAGQSGSSVEGAAGTAGEGAGTAGDKGSEIEEAAGGDGSGAGRELPLVDVNDPAWKSRKEERSRRREKRLTLLTASEDSDQVALGATARQAEEAAKARLSPPAGASLRQKYSAWKREEGPEGGNDQLVRLMRDQLIMARGYIAIAQQQGDVRLVRELKMRLKDSMKALGDATTDAELQPGAMERMRVMGQLLAKARDQHYDCTSMVKKLRAMVQAAEDQGRALKRQSMYLSQLAAKTMPKGLNCLSLKLTLEYMSLPPAEREFPGKHRLTNNSLHHYALFSDNVLAASVVVNSTVVNALDSSKHVFHLVTDRLNFAAIKMWFLLNPPRQATIEVASVDDFKWLNSSYCPVLHQLETASMKEYYFKNGNTGSATDGQFLKYRNPKYLSMLNHLRFYLPEVYPALDKILFVDDDIVVQQDLTPLWDVDLQGNVNGAVETCGASFHRFDKYLNFSHPLIAKKFDPQACGWAYGMNVFDLKAWKQQDITGIYHYWQSSNEDRQLWKLGTLPPGLITFYKKTKPLDKHFHALGMGYNPNLDMDELKRASVVHYNGNMKPWLDIGMAKFKPFWTKYVKYDHPFLQQCNINE